MNEKSVSLLGCPFCGRMDLSIEMEPGMGIKNPVEFWYVHCDYCESRSGSYKTIKLTMKHWNERASNAGIERPMKPQEGA